MRIGPQMSLAVNIVRNNPGCTKKYVAERISPCPDPSRNWAYGYNPVNRAIKAGLIRAEENGRSGPYGSWVSSYSLFVDEKE